MAQKTVVEMVRNRLPFLTAGDTVDEMINDYKQDVYYYLQPWSRILDDVVEDDSSYTGLKRVLVAEITAYNIVTRKIMVEMGGVNGSEASAGKRLKKAKADVVEAEFEYAKANDGGVLATDMNSLATELRNNVWNYAIGLGWYLPDCPKRMPVAIPGFQVFIPDTE